MATGSEGIPETAGFVSCNSPTRQFSQGMMALWDIGIYNPDTGEIADPELVESVQISMSSGDVSAADGQTVEASWKGDAEEDPHDYWVGSWEIPGDAETGTVEYDIEVSTTEGDSHLVGIAANEFSIIEFRDNLIVQTHPKSVEDNSGDGYQNSCGPEWQFVPGQDVYIVAEIWNPRNPDTHAAPSGDTWEGIVDSVTLTFPDGEFDSMEMEFAADPEADDIAEADRVFEATLELPDDVEPATYDYEVEVESSAEGILDTTSAISTFNVIDV
ncbi:MAG: hypothetical protein ACOCSF_01145 [Halanaeroarchaeum sp.]